jgi:hypothetical protein
MAFSRPLGRFGGRLRRRRRRPSLRRVRTEGARAAHRPAGQLHNGRWTPPSRASAAPEDWLLIGVICVAIVASALASALAVAAGRPKVYGARSDLLYESAPVTPLDVRDRTLATQRELIRSRAVLAPVAAQSGLTVEDLGAAVTVGVGSRSDLMHVTVGNRSRERALRLAQAVTTHYLGLSTRLSRSGDAESAHLQRQIAELTAGTRRAPPTERDIIAQRIGRLQDRVLELEAAGGASKPVLIAPAYALDQPLSPKPVRAAAAGLLVGLALAAVAAAALVRQAGGWRTS